MSSQDTSNLQPLPNPLVPLHFEFSEPKKINVDQLIENQFEKIDYLGQALRGFEKTLNFSDKKITDQTRNSIHAIKSEMSKLIEEVIALTAKKFMKGVVTEKDKTYLERLDHTLTTYQSFPTLNVYRTRKNIETIKITSDILSFVDKSSLFKFPRSMGWIISKLELLGNYQTTANLELIFALLELDNPPLIDLIFSYLQSKPNDFSRLVNLRGIVEILSPHEAAELHLPNLEKLFGSSSEKIDAFMGSLLRDNPPQIMPGIPSSLKPCFAEALCTISCLEERKLTYTFLSTFFKNSNHQLPVEIGNFLIKEMVKLPKTSYPFYIAQIAPYFDHLSLSKPYQNHPQALIQIWQQLSKFSPTKTIVILKIEKSLNTPADLSKTINILNQLKDLTIDQLTKNYELAKSVSANPSILLPLLLELSKLSSMKQKKHFCRQIQPFQSDAALCIGMIRSLSSISPRFRQPILTLVSRFDPIYQAKLIANFQSLSDSEMREYLSLASSLLINIQSEALANKLLQLIKLFPADLRSSKEIKDFIVIWRDAQVLDARLSFNSLTKDSTYNALFIMPSEKRSQKISSLTTLLRLKIQERAESMFTACQKQVQDFIKKNNNKKNINFSSISSFESILTLLESCRSIDFSSRHLIPNYEKNIHALEKSMSPYMSSETYLEIANKYTQGKDGFPVNEKKQRFYSEKSFETLKEDRSSLSLIKMYLTALGGPLNYYLARQHFDSLDKQGHQLIETTNLVTLGQLYLYGIGGPKNVKQGLILMRKAADRGDLNALRHLIVWNHRLKNVKKVHYWTQKWKKNRTLFIQDRVKNVGGHLLTLSNNDPATESLQFATSQHVQKSFLKKLREGSTSLGISPHETIIQQHPFSYERGVCAGMVMDFFSKLSLLKGHLETRLKQAAAPFESRPGISAVAFQILYQTLLDNPQSKSAKASLEGRHVALSHQNKIGSPKFPLTKTANDLAFSQLYKVNGFSCTPLHFSDESHDEERLKKWMEQEDGHYKVILNTNKESAHALLIVKQANSVYLWDPTYGLIACPEPNQIRIISDYLNELYPGLKDRHNLSISKVEKTEN